MSDLQKLQELTADAAQRGVTFNNVELGRSDAGDLILRTTTSGSAIEISIPEPLHIPISTVNMSTGQLDEKADMDESLRDWVNAYLAALVTDEDRQTLSGIREAIDAENLTANSAFRGLGIANFLTINTKIEALNQALLAPSVVATNKGQVLLPILGAARPGNMGVPLNITAGGSFRATGKDIQDEIRVTAGRFDSMHSLNAHGRVLSFGATFSLPATLSLQDQRTLVIGRNFNETRTVGQAQVPKAWADGSARNAHGDIVNARADIVEAHAKRTRSVRFACVSTMSECASTMLRVRSAPGRPKIWPEGLVRPIQELVNI